MKVLSALLALVLSAPLATADPCEELIDYMKELQEEIGWGLPMGEIESDDTPPVTMALSFVESLDFLVSYDGGTPILIQASCVDGVLTLVDPSTGAITVIKIEDDKLVVTSEWGDAEPTRMVWDAEGKLDADLKCGCYISPDAHQPRQTLTCKSEDCDVAEECAKNFTNATAGNCRWYSPPLSSN